MTQARARTRSQGVTGDTGPSTIAVGIRILERVWLNNENSLTLSFHQLHLATTTVCHVM